MKRGIVHCQRRQGECARAHVAHDQRKRVAAADDSVSKIQIRRTERNVRRIDGRDSVSSEREGIGVSIAVCGYSDRLIEFSMSLLPVCINLPISPVLFR